MMKLLNYKLKEKHKKVMVTGLPLPQIGQAPVIARPLPAAMAKPMMDHFGGIIEPLVHPVFKIGRITFIIIAEKHQHQIII